MTDSDRDPGTIDRAFARFRDHGDPQGLAEVFDATAPELVRIARHLVHDVHAADDLVQATFLAAIDAAPRYDASRRVTPWLVGILANHVANFRRQRRLAPIVADELRAEAADPAHAAASRELATACAVALRGLPAPYGDVVRLTVEGLRPVEVARTLRRPEGTVRSQLSRGLELLRQALPATSVVIAAAHVGTGELAAMRGVVLARAASGAKGVSLGGLAAKLVLACGLLLSVTLGWFALRPAPAVVDANVGSAPVAVVAGAAESGATPTPARDLAVPGAAPHAAPAPRVEPATHVRLVGTCADRDGGAVSALVEEWTLASAQWRREVRAAADATGRFALDVSTADDVVLALRSPRQGSVCVTVPARALFAHRGGELDLGTIALPAGVQVAGRLDAPAPRAGLRIVLMPVDVMPLDGGNVGRSGARVAAAEVSALLTGATFVCDELLCPGRYSVAVEGARSVVPAEIDVPPGMTAFELMSTVTWWDPVDAIDGVVVDAAGAAVADAIVEVNAEANGDDARPVGSRVLTDAQGRFRCTHGDATATALRLEAHAQVGSASPVVTRWGAQGVRLVLEPAARVTLQVVAADDGAPVEHFGVQRQVVQREDVQVAAVALGPDLQHDRRHPGGRLQLSPAGQRERCRVVPMDESLVPTIVEWSASPVGSVEVRLARRVECRVQVVDALGAPVAGARVQELGVLGDAEPRRARPQSPGDALAAVAAVIGGAQAETDRDGVARLSTAAAERAVLAVQAPRGERLVVDGVRLSATAPWVVRLPGAMTVAGRLTGEPFLKTLRAVDYAGMPPFEIGVDFTTAALVLWTEADAAAPRAGRTDLPAAPVARDGTFTLHCPHRPGVLWLQQGVATRWARTIRPAQPLGAVQPRGDGVVEFASDVAAFALAALHVDVRVAGALPVGGAGESFELSAGAADQASASRVERDGRAVLVLAPGRYDWLRLARKREVVESAQSVGVHITGLLSAPLLGVELSPGQALRVPVDFAAAQVTLRVPPELTAGRRWLRLRGETPDLRLDLACALGIVDQPLLFAPGLLRVELTSVDSFDFVEVARAQLAPQAATTLDVPPR